MRGLRCGVVRGLRCGAVRDSNCGAEKEVGHSVTKRCGEGLRVARGHYRQFCGRSDHIMAGKTFMPYGSRKFWAAQGGFSGNMAGARCAIFAPKFSQIFFIFKVTGCCFRAG